MGSPRFRCAIRHGRRHRPRYPFDPQAGTVILNPSAASASVVRCSTSLPKPAFHSWPHSTEAPTRRGWPGCRLAATTASRARWSGCSSPSADRRSLAATTRGAKVSSSPSPTVSVRTMSSAAYPPSRSTTGRCQPVRVDGGDQRRQPLPAPGGVPDPRRRGARLRERPAGRWVRLVGLHRQLPGGFPLVVSQRGLVALALARGRVSAEPRAARAAGARLRLPSSRCRATIAASIPARP